MSMGPFVASGIAGVGQGAVFGLLALGIVIVYRGTGVINLAQGAFAMISAFAFQQGLTRMDLDNTTAALFAVVLTCAAAAVTYLLVFRPLRHAPVLAKLVGCLGLVLVAEAGVQLIVGTGSVPPPSLFPETGSVFAGAVRLAGYPVPRVSLWLLAIGVVLAIGLSAAYHYSRLGLVAEAAWESSKGASLLGYSVNRVGLATWVLGAGLGGLAGVLSAGIQAGGLTITNLTFLVIPALAAALVARFSSFLLAFAAGVLLGMVEGALTYFVTINYNSWFEPGWVPTLPLVVIVIVLIVRGTSIPTRGDEVTTDRLPAAPRPTSARVPAALIVIVPVVLVALLVSGGEMQNALTNSLIAVPAGLSLVLLTGYLGQVSLGQIALAGFAAFSAAKLSTSAGLPMQVALPLSAVCAVPIGLLFGLPALRVRGPNLAIVTLAGGVAVEDLILQSHHLAGGYAGLRVTGSSFFGLDLSPLSQPTRFAIFVLIIDVLATLVVRNVRRGLTGQRFLAVRANERAASASGINVARTKLLGFTISALLAGLCGALMAYQGGSVEWSTYDVGLSIFLIASVYVAGIGTVGGAWLAAVSVASGVVQQLLHFASNFVLWVNLALGLLLLLTLVRAPDGGAVLVSQRWQQLRRALTDRRHPGAPTVTGTESLDGTSWELASERADPASRGMDARPTSTDRSLL
jgi:ABC-type branched-subunit amino acid transport system permease subunit